MSKISTAQSKYIVLVSKKSPSLKFASLIYKMAYYQKKCYFYLTVAVVYKLKTENRQQYL
jgi:hypothetical protein